MPIGPARIAETNLGFEANLAILGLGAVGLIVVLIARALPPAIRSALSDSGASGAPSRPSVLAEAAARAGFAPPVTSGVRMAFEQRRGTRILPLRSALGGSIIGLAVLMAALMFGASLNRLVTVPRQFGQRWDFIADSSFGILPLRANESALRSDPDLAGYTAGNYGSLVIGQRDVPTIGLQRLKGDVYPLLLEGRAAEKPDEIVLGTTVLRRLKTAIGRTIPVDFPLKQAPTQMRIVGRAVFPTLGRGDFAPPSLGDGAAVIADDFAYLEKTFVPDATETNNFLLVKLRAGADRAAVKQRLLARFVNPQCGSTNDCSLSFTQRPIELNVLTRVRSVPLILAGLLALFAAATLTHALLTSVRLRARDLAVLKTMGFVRRQIRATVAWQTSALAVTTLVFGLPLGVIVGRAVWSVFADSLGVPGDPAISIAVFLVAVPSTLALANVIGALPARAAARTEAAVVLRTE
jgi:MacB-like periplasmic core domain/FtsX-like permease family